MKHVNLTAADIEKLKKALPAAKLPAPPLHHEEMILDGVGIGLSRPAGSDDPRTITHAFTFRSGDSDCLIVVVPQSTESLPSLSTSSEKGMARPERRSSRATPCSKTPLRP